MCANTKIIPIKITIYYWTNTRLRYFPITCICNIFTKYIILWYIGVYEFIYIKRNHIFKMFALNECFDFVIFGYNSDRLKFSLMPKDINIINDINIVYIGFIEFTTYHPKTKCKISWNTNNIIIKISEDDGCCIKTVVNYDNILIKCLEGWRELAIRKKYPMMKISIN